MRRWVHKTVSRLSFSKRLDAATSNLSGLTVAALNTSRAAGLLGKNWLKGADGDALHALLCGAGHNLRMILRHLRVLYCAVLGVIAMAASQLWKLLTSPLPLNVLTEGQISLQRG